MEVSTALLDQLDYNYENLLKLLDSLNTHLEDVKQQRIDLDNKALFLIKTQEYFKGGIDVIYQNSIDELKDTLNSALKYIFEDDFEIDFDLNDKRGKSLTMLVKHKGNIVSLKDGMGMGVICAISAILHIYYLYYKGKRLLCIDEAYHNVDRYHIEKFFGFLQQLCLKLEFKLIIISHDERILPYSNKFFYVNGGNIYEGQEGVDKFLIEKKEGGTVQ